MALILSCLVNNADDTRCILDHLRREGWPPGDITVLHGGDVLTSQPTQTDADAGSATAMVAGGSAAVAAGAFGWLVGYGVLAVPAALLGAAMGSAAGAAVGSATAEDAGLRDLLMRHYRAQIRNRDRANEGAAVLVRADDARGYDLVMCAFQAGNGQDIQVVGKGRLEPTAPAVHSDS